MKTEWWYDDATFHYSGDRDIHLARLTVRPDGTAEVVTASERLPFPDKDAANEWLTSEEFSLLDTLTETFEEAGKSVGTRLQPPPANLNGDLARYMVITLG